MSILLWVMQAALAFLFFAGGATKAFRYEQLAAMPAMQALSKGAWRAVGLLEMMGAVSLIVPQATGWMPELTSIAAAVLAVESTALAVLYGRYSRKLDPANPLVWSAVMAVLACVLAYARCPL